ncbi:reprolysin-like metallopeptidase [Winogradskyella sp. KYW1333]|uniref:reprolysin-like metallopeptidase n=1 Tax=Winogradskyella sp. KYW1333 TaxID=2282123 RepID=UPI000DF2A3BC|nr:zinc-dependent metalloprotease family protein [Winogradskyella sp. KYW1333]RCT55921.1 T9SS C-terminal target domain-containing protein [Winogradskyella sp. KYW1333]
MKRALLTMLSLIMVLPFFAQNHKDVWTKKQESELTQKSRNLERVITLNKYEIFSLNLNQLRSSINAAPKRISNSLAGSNTIMKFPNSDGSMENYRVQKTDVMHPDLAVKYPGISTYYGQSISNPLNKIYFTITSQGFRGLITGERTVYIDPYAKGDVQNYVVYNRKDYTRIQSDNWRCYADEVENEVNENFDSRIIDRNIQDGRLRQYEIAIACTSEYTAYHDDGDNGNGDAKADALAAMVITVARVNSVFERDFAVTFQLVANNDLLIYENGFTTGGDPEPYDNYSGSQMLGVNTSNISGIIGSGGYDIGHVFSTGGGGIAGTSPCATSSKGRGVTGIVTPEFDPFDIDYVSHEIGHQYGAGHTYYNACFGSKVSDDYEPGSASTIMGYAGICASNVQDNSDGYFHARSIVQMSASILADACETEIIIANADPTADAGSNYTIPISTPFILDASGSSDPDAGDVLTYNWEQYDNDGTYTQPPLSTNAGGPVFRTNFPVADPTRTFPNLEAVINNETPTWEVLPSVGRQLDFRLTVRDNSILGGQTDQDDTVITVSSSAGPFLVTSPNTGSEIWYVGETKTITWDVNNTASLSSNVNILLSTDGGYTYPVTLASSVSNDGFQDIVVPDNVGVTNRIKIEASSNIFFDLSNADFEIKAGTFEITASNPTVSVCQPADAVFNLNYNPAPAFSENVQFSAIGLPGGTIANFTPNSLNTAGAFSMTISNTGTVSTGNYPITVQGKGQSTFVTETYEVLLNVFDNNIGAVSLFSPVNGAQNQSSDLLLTWDSLTSASQYDIEISDAPDFSSVIESATVVNATEYQTTNLLAGTIYYWRVKPENTCLAGNFGEIYVFQTANDVCNTYDNEYFENGDNTWETFSNNAVSARVDVPDDIIVNEVTFYMDATHSDVGDIKMQFSSPTGIFAEVYNRDCADGNSFDVTFTDSGSSLSCSGTPQVSGNVLPSQAFTRFNGTSGQGTWVLLATDRTSNSAGGTFNQFSVTICGKLQIVNDVTIVNKTDITLDEGTSTVINLTELEVAQPVATNNDLNYVITQVPVNGVLLLNAMPISIGDTFSQTDIQNGLLSYSHGGANVDPDSFKFSVEGNNSAILGNQQFNFNIQPVLGTEEFNSNDVLVYPNPNKGDFNIVMNREFQDVNIQLFDIQGREIFNKKHGVDSNTININNINLSSGVYLLRINADGNVLDKKLVIKK